MSVLGVLGGIASAAGAIGSLFGKKSSGNAVDKASGVASALGGLGSMFGSQQDQQRLYQQQLLYNSPKEQMARLKEAGLNPNLIYGSQGVTGMSASDATAPNLEQYKENPVLKMTPQQIQEMAIQRKHQENEDTSVQSNVSLNKEKEKTEQAKQRNLDSDTKRTGEETIKLRNFNSLFDLQHDIYKYQKELAYSNSQLAERQLNIIDSNYNNLVQQVREDLNHTIKSNKLLDAQESKVIAETLAIPFEILSLRASAGLANQEALKLALDNDWLIQTSTDSKGNKVKNYYRVNEAKLRNLTNSARGKHLTNLFGSGTIGSLMRIMAGGISTSIPFGVSEFLRKGDAYINNYSHDENQYK